MYIRAVVRVHARWRVVGGESKYANPAAAGTIIPVDLFAPRKRVFGKTNNACAGPRIGVRCCALSVEPR